MFGTPPHPAGTLLESPGSGSSAHTWASVFVTPRKPHARSPPPNALPAPLTTQRAARAYCRARRLEVASAGLVWALASPALLALGGGWRSLALARLTWALGALLLNVPHVCAPRFGLRGALCVRVIAWALLVPAIWAVLHLPVLDERLRTPIAATAIVPLLMLLEGATSAPPPVFDAHLLEMQLQAEFSMNVPRHLLRSLAPLQRWREAGVLIAAPVLAMVAFFGVLAWRGPPTLLGAALAVAVVALSLFALVALGGCSRARTVVVPQFVHASPTLATPAVPVPATFTTEPPRGRLRRLQAFWRGSALYSLMRLVAGCPQRRSLLPRCWLLAASHALEDAVVTTMLPCACFALSMAATPRPTAQGARSSQLLQAALASACCIAAFRLGRGCIGAVGATCRRLRRGKYATAAGGRSLTASPDVGPRQPRLATSPLGRAEYQTPPAGGHSSPLPQLPSLPPAMRAVQGAAAAPRLSPTAACWTAAPLAALAALALPGAQELSTRLALPTASPLPQAELVLGAAALAAGLLLDVAHRCAAQLLPRATSTLGATHAEHAPCAGGGAHLDGVASPSVGLGAQPPSASPSPHAPAAAAQLSGALQLLLGAALQPAACVAFGLLPLRDALWAVGAAAAGLVLAVQLLASCCASGALAEAAAPLLADAAQPASCGPPRERVCRFQDDAPRPRRLQLDADGR